jgi:hypothetical protein
LLAESKIKDTNFFLVNGWMINRLNLKGAALQVFAIIYGFSQDGEGSFTGSLQYLCDFTNSSKNTVIKALKELVEKEYITKTENSINGVRFCTYKANAPLVQNLNMGSAETEPGGSSEIAPPPGAETEPNNKDLDNKSFISKEIQEVIDLYSTICVSFPVIRVVSPVRQEVIKERLKTYSLEDFRTVFENAEGSSFLKGQNDRNWSANFDWLIDKNNIVKVLEGNYADKPKRYGRKEPVPGWMGFELGEAEIAAVQKVLQNDPVTAGENPELAERAEQLRQRLGG